MSIRSWTWFDSDLDAISNLASSRGSLAGSTFTLGKSITFSEQDLVYSSNGFIISSPSTPTRDKKGRGQDKKGLFREEYYSDEVQSLVGDGSKPSFDLGYQTQSKSEGDLFQTQEDARSAVFIDIDQLMSDSDTNTEDDITPINQRLSQQRYSNNDIPILSARPVCEGSSGDSTFSFDCSSEHELAHDMLSSSGSGSEVSSSGNEAAPRRSVDSTERLSLNADSVTELSSLEHDPTYTKPLYSKPYPTSDLGSSRRGTSNPPSLEPYSSTPPPPSEGGTIPPTPPGEEESERSLPHFINMFGHGSPDLYGRLYFGSQEDLVGDKVGLQIQIYVCNPH